MLQAALMQQMRIERPDQHAVPGCRGDVGAFAGDGEHGAEGGGAVPPAAEEGEHGPGAVAAAGVQVGHVVAEVGRGVDVAGDDEDVGTVGSADEVAVGAFAQGEVAGAAEGGGGVGDVDGRGVVCVEGDGDFEVGVDQGRGDGDVG